MQSEANTTKVNTADVSTTNVVTADRKTVVRQQIPQIPPQPNVVELLNQLARLNHESERGFETAAEHVKNRGLKILIKTFAQQRAHFTTELMCRARLDPADAGHKRDLRTYTAMLHRGWIDLKAAMTIGRANTERIVLAESKRAEGGVALRAYEQALESSLPDSIRERLEIQHQQIINVHQQLHQMSGQGGTHKLVQFVEQQAHADQIVARMNGMGLPIANVHIKPVREIMQSYDCGCQRERVAEGISAGALTGALIGLVLGLLTAAGTAYGMEIGSLGALVAWIGSIGLLFGAGLGALFGWLIGQATVEDDSHFYHDGADQQGYLLIVDAPSAHAREIRTLMYNERWQMAGALVPAV